MDNHQPPVPVFKRVLCWLISGLLIWQPVAPAFAAALTPQGPTSKDTAGNGVPVINIATPNSAGVSHNQFHDYNVGPEGLILNNATGQLNPTQLGGLIQNNPNLKAGHEAQAIINEVNGGNRSQLQGYTEVAGKAASVMVANPYGITCNGCGFINTPNVTLTTGKPQFDASGKLIAVEATKGSITVEGKGLDASDSDALTLISRATEINAAIHARNLTVVAGANRVGSDGKVTPVSGEGSTPAVAVDTGALGGMYANRIHLVSSDKGVGVNLGNLVARQGDITLDASGQLRMNNSLASGVLSAKGESLALTGDNKAGGNLSLDSQGDIVLSNGSLNSNRDLVLNASGTVSHAHEKLTAGRDATLTAKNIRQDGASQINVARDIAVKASDTLKIQGQMTAGQNLTVSSNTLMQDGKLLAHNRVQFSASTLNNSGSVQGDSLSVDSSTLSNPGSLLSGGNLTINTRDFTQSGSTGAKGPVDITASGALTSTGSLVSDDSLALEAQSLVQNGVLSGRKGLTVNVQTLSSGKNSVTHSDAAIMLNATMAALDGETSAGGDLQLQSDKLTTVESAQLQSDSNLRLSARETALAGTQVAQKNMMVNAREKLTHSGKSSAASLSLSAPELTNSGVLVASILNTNSQTLTNSGLMQGNSSLLIGTQKLDNQQNGTLYSAENLMLDIPDIRNSGLITSDNGLMLSSGSLSNPGKIIADTLNVKATTLNGDGLLQGTGAMTLVGDMLSQGPGGRWLTAGGFSLNGKTLNTVGTTQGQNLTVQADSWVNSGSVLATGNLNTTLGTSLLNGGDLMSLGNFALAAPTLTNHGNLLSAGDLVLTGKTLSSDGALQGNTLRLTQENIANQGNMTGLQGLTLNSAGSLNNSGNLLSQKSLTLSAEDISNSGLLQGDDTRVNASSLTNSGRVQGGSGLTFTLLNILTNQASGMLLSQNALNITVPLLVNDGMVQGNGKTTLSAATQTRNSGNIFTGDDLTFTTPDYSGSGRLQATDLVLNVAKLASDGTVMAKNLATFTGNSLDNRGTIQAAQLNVNSQIVANSGTLLGNQGLALKGNSFNNAGGKVFSGGDMLTEMVSLSGAGQLVALGNLTLTLTDSLITQGVITANRQLAISTLGDITNASTLQGNGITLNAAGRLTNNGQLTAGSGTMALSGSQVVMNASGNLQAGGDVSLTSRGSIILDGFTGTAGNLLLNAAGSIINTALLYAGNNLSLFASSIQNRHGDILAGYNLLMQRDASGTANAEVINTSGNIETTNGDIIIKTGHLLNTRDGLTTKTTQVDGSQSIPGMGDATIKVDIGQLADGTYGMTSRVGERQVGPCNGHGGCDYIHWNQFYYAMYAGSAEQKFISSQVRTDVTSQGSVSRIASGKNITINAGSLENFASNILANGDASLTGNSLNNQSWQDGTVTDWLIYQYDSRRYGYAVEPGGRYPTDGNSYKDVMPKDPTIAFTLKGHDSDTELGEIYRSVIQSGGRVSVNFSNDISNTNSTASAGKISNTIFAPNLNTPSAQSIDDGASEQELADAGNLVITGPYWEDTIASKTISSGTGFATGGIYGNYPLPSGNKGYFVPSTDPDSPYLITVNPKLDGLGQPDPSLFGDLYKLLGMKPSAAPHETGSQYTNVSQFLGSSYMLSRLNLNPDTDYRFLGDAAFDTRYVSNAILNQTGSRYLNGVGSDLDQMRYLMDNAASAQKSLGLQFGESLSAAQIASLDHSILWWESTTINGQTVMVPKLYLAAQDATVNNGSVIAGNNVNLKAGNITSDGSTVLAANSLALDSDTSISNLNDGLIKAGGGLSLSAVSDINNISATIAGKTVSLESLGGSINNLTRADTTTINAWSKYGNVTLKNTALGNTAGITAEDSLALSAGKDISVTGATLTSGGDMLMQARGDIAVNARQVDDQYTTTGFRGHNDTNNASVTWQGSNVTAGGNLSVQAGHDITLAASDVNAGGSAQLAAANDLNLNSGQTSRNTRNGASETHSTGLDRTTVSAGNNLVLQAGQDINAHSAALAAEQGVGLQAGRDVNLLADKTTQGDSYRTKKKTVINDQVRQQGTEIASGGNTVVIAGRDVNSQAAQVTAQGDIGVQAVNDINLGTATESDYHYQEETKKKKGFLSKTTTHTISEQSATRETGSLLSGDNVSVSSGHDLQVQGSSVVGDGAVSLAASNNVDITAATNTDTNWQFKEKKKSGLMSSGGIGFTIGSTKTRQDLKEKGTTQSQSTSTIGSNGGDVTITAGNQLHIAGSDVVAGQDLALKGDSVVIDPGHDKRTTDQTFEQKSSGLTVALTGAVIDAVNNAVSTAKAASKQSDSRLAALQATKSVLSGVQAVQANSVANATGQPDAGIHVSVSLSTQKSKSTQHQESDTVTGSTLNAGKNLSVEATGRQQQGNSGDIVIAGSHVKAAGDTSLKAERDIILTAAANTQKTTGSNSSSGGGVGVSIGAGQGGFGISVFASVNAAKGHEKGDGTDWSETTLDSGGKVSVSGGRDTTLTGAQVNGNQVTVDTGRNLTITSLQDSNNYDSKQSSVSAGGSFTFGSMSGSGYINFSQDKMHSIYDSVAEQSGIFAGDGGFSVTTGNHTQLNGGAIASTAAAADNHLNTGTLGFSDIVNKADYNVSHTGGGFSSSGSIGGQFAGNMATTLLSGMSSSGHAEGTTQAVVSQGTITIRDRSGQQQDLSGLQRDVTKANDAISPIFDKEKEQNRLQAVQMIGEIGSQVGDIARTEGQLRAIEAGKAELAKNGTKEPEAGASQDEWNRYNKSVENTESYKSTAQQYGTGSDLQRAITAAT
ncbi:hemagglutinin repeat-containing protein, partial [Mangrovibacter phragmitis]|uniref:hemagglutinin repeat-containing protein n=1 Tax=Mangrovibacter phragmitis TaxID=1691903 RepID=UPI003517CC1B